MPLLDKTKEVITLAESAISYPVAVDVLKECSTQALELTIKGLDDKGGRKAVSEAKKVLRSHRTAIEKKRKELKQDALYYGRKVDEVARGLQDIIEPGETHLKKEEEKIKEEEKRIAEEAQRKIDEKIASRKKELVLAGGRFDGTQFGYGTETIFNPITEITIASADEDQWTAEIKKVKIWKKEQDEFEARQHELAIEAQRKREEEEKAEKERQEKIAEENRKREEEMKKREAAVAERERKLKEAEEKTAAEKREKERQAELEEAKKKAAEQAKKAEEERIKREAEEKAEAERQEKRRLAEIEKQRPDKQKLANMMAQLNCIEYPSLKTKKANTVKTQIKDILNSAIVECTSLINSL